MESGDNQYKLSKMGMAIKQVSPLVSKKLQVRKDDGVW
jgi:hypothetical protein